MEASQEAVALLSMATRKGLIAQESAVGIKQAIDSGVHAPGAKPIADLLVKEGHITATQAELLLQEFTKSQGPKVIGGHQLISKLGQGGMGSVFKALQLSLQREVALKLLSPHLAKDKEFAERFVREARAAGKVVHANVISCYDVGIDQGVAYMSLELVAGGDALKRAQAAGGKLPEREAVSIIRDCARGLAAIHKAGLIHRDIKPANIFLTEDGVAKLADLGLARSASGEDQMTQTGATVGSPAYMSPEQAKGAHDLDIRSDIYSLGATLFHLLCGHPPFTASSVFATVSKVINDPLPDPRAVNPSISPQASALIKRAMTKDRGQRVQTPEELLAACEAVLAGKSAPLPAVAGQVRRPHSIHSPPLHHERSPQTAKRPPVGLIAGGAVVGVLALLIGGLALAGGKNPPAQTAPPPPPPVVMAARPTPTTPVRTTASTPSPVVAPTPTPTPTPRQEIRERIVERIEDRLAAPAVTQPAQPAPPTQPVAPAMPAWAEAAAKTFDLAMAGNFAAAGESAKAMPKPQQDAVAALATARGSLTAVYQTQGEVFAAAKLTLPSAPTVPGLALAGASDKGLRYANPEGTMATTLLWDRLTSADHDLLIKEIDRSKLSTAHRSVMVRLGLNSPEAVANADSGDKVVAAMQEMLKAKVAYEAEVAKAKAEADRLEREAQARLAATAGPMEDRTRRVIRSIIEVSTFSPRVLSGEITGAVELRDFVVLAPNVRLAPGARLVPTAGALVVNLTEKVGYQPIEIHGMPFVSIGGSPGHTSFQGQVGEGTLFSNCIFYGNSLIDGFGSPNFRACSFIGSGLPGLPFPLTDIHNLSGRVRTGQVQFCDFVRVSFKGAVSLGSIDRCYFSGVRLDNGAGVPGATSLTAWDPAGAFQRVLDGAGVPVRLLPQEGRPQSPFGFDAPAVGNAIDAIFLKWAPEIQRLVGGG